MKAFDFNSKDAIAKAPTVVYELNGYIDANTVLDFEKAAQQSITKGVNNIILDINGLTYISSAGIGAMMGLMRTLTRNNGQLILLNPTPKVFTILDGLGFTKIFPIVQTEAQALDLIDSVN